jgi:hypothetical protein
MGLSSAKDSITKGSEKCSSMRHCQACSTEKDSDELSRCKGCESVWYCDKVREPHRCEINKADLESDLSNEGLE